MLFQGQLLSLDLGLDWLTHGLLQLFEVVSFKLLLLRCEIGFRGHEETKAVLVVHQVLLDQVLEQGTRFEVFPYSLTELIDLEEVEGISTMYHLGDHIGQVPQPCLILGLLDLQFQLGEDGVEQFLVDTVLRSSEQGLVDRVFSFLEVG